MKNLKVKKCIAMIATLFPFTIFAAEESPDWQVDIAPYIWTISMNGTVANGPLTAHIDESFDDLLRHFDSGGMLWLDAYKGRLGFFLNGLYVDLSDNDTLEDENLEASSHFGLISGGFSYLLSTYKTKYGVIDLEPYVGLRYTVNSATVKIPHESSYKTKQDWTDPIIGLRVKEHINPRLSVTIAGDIGGVNNNQESYNLVALLGYQPDSKTFSNATLYLGYRYLYENYETGNLNNFFEWKMHLYGPMAGINFHLE